MVTTSNATGEAGAQSQPDAPSSMAHPAAEPAVSSPPPLPPQRRTPLHRQVLFALFFLGAFLLLDGSSTASQHWEGAPPWYLPVGLSFAFFLSAGSWASLLVLVCSIIAAALNYHRPFFSWCGIPGAIGVYVGYLAAAELLKRRWHADLRRGRLRDVVQYLVAGFGGSLVSTAVGVLTLLQDGFIHRSEFVRTATEWWFSDAVALVAFTPFLVLFICPPARHWLNPAPARQSGAMRKPRSSPAEKLELVAQAALAVFAIWLVFAYEPAMPYQPLYLLFVPVLWVAVRRGLRGTVQATFAIGVGMTIAAWVTRAHPGSLPRLQLATLVLSLTGLFLGAVVTERRFSEQSLRDSERRYRLLFEQNLTGVFRATLDGKILACNPAAATLFGFDSPSEVLNLQLDDLYSGIPDRDALLATLAGNELRANYEIRLHRRAGESVWAMLNLSLVAGESVNEDVVQGTLVDITERKQAEDRAQSLAYYDPLTALPNRTFLRDRLSQALAAARLSNEKVGVLFLDLDHFKMINDSLGHSVGDSLLKAVSERLRTCVRDQDTIARLGGDEFVIVLTHLKEPRIISVAAERFLDSMTTEFVIQGHTLRIGCSMGISIFPEHGADAEALIRNADCAMYCAKDNGRNNYQIFTDNMNQQALERLNLESALRLAMDEHQLFLVYQPQLDAHTGNVVGVEALLRWQHPQWGLVPPDRFIRVAETSGLILPIGDWVLKTACCQVREWEERGLPLLPVAVNVSAVQFRHVGFCQRVRSVLDECALPPGFLELELTESVLLVNADRALAALRDLNAMGVKLAIDDFGMGYSSLSYLKRFPVSTLKIDRAFIRNIPGAPDDAAITTAIINMAKALNLRVIAEGVENESQLSFLRAHQCQAVQGFHLCRPLRDENMAQWLSDRVGSAVARPTPVTAGSLGDLNQTAVEVVP